MIDHVVLVEVPRNAQERRDEIIALFQGFEGAIPGVTQAHAGTDIGGRCEPYSVVAVLRMESPEALAGYATHADHRKLITLLDELGCRRIVADIEV